MKLVCGCVYDVAIITRREFNPGKIPNHFHAKLVYCGGSIVDYEGHYVAGGVWAHASTDHRGAQYRDLPIMCITPVCEPGHFEPMHHFTYRDQMASRR